MIILNEKLKKAFKDQEENYKLLIKELKDEAKDKRAIFIETEYVLRKIDIKSEERSPYFVFLIDMVFNLEKLV